MVEQMAETFRDNQFERNEKIMATENDVSVSFGKFENDLLSWDKWSSFSQNKYLEEVEKCATPGSVASKKAYFEAHYKKIAARKAAVELLEQEQQLEGGSVTSNCRRNNGKQAQDEDDTFEFDLGRGNRTQGFRKCKLSLSHAAESTQDADGMNCQVSVSQVNKEEMYGQQHNFKAVELEASVSCRGETPDEESKTETKEFERSTSAKVESQQHSQEHNVKNTEMHSQTHNSGVEDLEAYVSCRAEVPDKKSKTETKELETSTAAQGENQQCSQEHNVRNAEMHSQKHNLETKELEPSVSAQLENPLERSKPQTEEVVLVEEKNCYNESHAKVEEVKENKSVSLPPASDKEENNMSTKSQEQVEVETHSGRAQSETATTGHVEEIETTTKLKPRKEPRKVHPRVSAAKEKIPAKTTRKLATPKTKAAVQTSGTKASKPSPAISTTSRTPARKDSSPSLLKNRQSFSADKKRSTSSTSLHMSLNAPPVKSDSTFLNTTRRSLIMEQMGDKEIVKRAFKAFKNTYGTPLSNGEGTSSTSQQLPERTPSSTIPQKDKKGTRMSLGKASPHTKQVAARPTTIGSPARPAGVKQTTTKASTNSPFILTSEVKAEKHKEVMKTHDKATEVDKPSRLRSKSKDVAHLNMSWR